MLYKQNIVILKIKVNWHFENNLEYIILLKMQNGTI